MLLDTNIVIYSCKADGDLLQQWTRHPNAAIASIARVEALGFTGISASEESRIRSYLNESLVYPLDDEIIERAIGLRQQRRMKLGDAVIAATALEYDLPLVTRNEGDFKHIAELTIFNPFGP